MTASAVLQVQELCDQIADSLVESSSDLKACALISPTLTSSAQRRLFCDIVLNRGCLGIEDISLLQNLDEPAACTRFCAVLVASPHLVPLVRRLRVSLEEEVVKQLSAVKFPNLQVIVFHRRIGGAATEGTLSSAAEIIRLPSITRVGMLFPIFENMQDLGRLFEHCTPNLGSLFLHQITVNSKPDANSTASQYAKIHHLRLSERTIPDWFLYPSCPFDLSLLSNVDYSAVIEIKSVIPMLDKSRATITHLKLHAQDIEYAESATLQATSITRYPSLTHLSVVVSAHTADVDASALLAQLPPTNRIQVLALDIRGLRDASALRGLGSALAGTSLPALRRLAIVGRRIAAGAEGVRAEAEVQLHGAFVKFEERGVLDVVVY
ncbi:hypothetical protein C8R44DRAFT_989178 [Mycena epipterygia]|nr:hypothetical protein C8R44DRAFT_989178 [Mycena epipterygia]